MKKVNFLVAGGSGHWCELNHYPAIRALKDEGIDAKVVAICDPIDPYSTNPEHYKVGRDNLNTILENDKPIWVNPRDYTRTELMRQLDKVAKDNRVDIVIVATDPTQHFFYAEWAVDKGISVLCDKPLIVVPDASWKPEKAELIEKRFRILFDKVQQAQKRNPQFRFCTPLRRRALTPFVAISESLELIHGQTGQGLTYMNAIVNGGVHRYPVEYLKGGAHGYIDGVGSLSHSSYHYLDVIAWYLQAAPGTLARIGVTLPYVSRVKDYLAKQGYEQLMRLNSENPSIVEGGVKLPKSVLNAELDFTVHLHLYDKADRKIGLISYTSNHTTFTPRTTKYDPDMLDHTNDKDGGRMSQIYFDIHQGSVQNWLLTKNDAVFEGNDVDITQRLHPGLGQNYSKMSYTDAYDSQTVTPKDLFASFVKKSVGLSVPEKHDEHLQLLNSQELTHRIFSATYELIASQYANPGSNQEISITMGGPHEVSENQATTQ